MNLVESILRLKEMNRKLYIADEKDKNDLLYEMTEYIENMELPVLLNKPEVIEVIDIIQEPGYELKN